MDRVPQLNQEKRAEFPYELVLVVPIVLVLGAVALLAGWGAMRDAQYQPTPATLAKLELRTSDSGAKGGPFVRAHLRYRYTVDGTVYEGSRYMRHWEGDLEYESFKQKHPDTELRLQELRRLTTLTVYYDPEDPTQSVRTRRSLDEAHFPGGLALAGAFWSLLRLGRWLRRDARQRAELPPA